ncbi:MAG: hypothetical protein WD472_06225 [Dehalococcoidia bacterium]
MPAVLIAPVALTAILISCGDAEEEIAPAPTAATATPDATQGPNATASPNPDFKTLTNTAYGYSLRYPSDWLVNPGDTETDPTTASYVVIWSGPPPTGPDKPDPNLVKFEIYAVLNPGRLTLDEWLADRDRESPLPLTILSSKDIDVGGIVAQTRLLQYQGEGTGEPFVVIDVPREGFVLEIVGVPDEDSPLRAKTDLIISSVAFE